MEGERNWEKAKGQDPFWDLSVDELKKIERDKRNNTAKVRERAKKIRKQKQKNCK